MREIDIQGQRFGQLLAVGKSRKKFANGVVRWRCKCDCGNTTDALSINLRNGRTKSCGCIRFKSGLDHYRVKGYVQKYGTWIPKEDRWYMRAAGALRRAKTSGIPTDFESTKDLAHYLQEIAPDVCPVFGEPMTNGDRKRHKWSPSIDRIDSRKGYIRGNLQVISGLANTMKQDATNDQLVKFSVWALKFVLGKDVQILVKGKEL